jgi:hypothetical protein
MDLICQDDNKSASSYTDDCEKPGNSLAFFIYATK